MMNVQHIAIIGAGTAGLASARILAHQGHHVSLFEKAEQLENVGAGLLLQPSGLAVFEHMGVLDAALTLGAPVSGLEGRLADGHLLVNSHYREVHPHSSGLGMHRASLCHVLMQGLAEHAIEWHMGVNVEQIQQQKDKIQLNGLTRDEYAFKSSFDAVIIANGARSHLRPPNWVKLDKAYPWGAAWCIVPACHTLPANILHQFYHGSRTMMGILPTGSIPQRTQQPLSSVFWSLPQASLNEWLQHQQQGKHDWLPDVAQYWPEAAEWLHQVVPQASWLAASYRDVVLSRYGAGRVGIIGDAAHAMSPQLGQGVNMALLDAWALGQAVQQAQDWDHVWLNYHRIRLSSIRFYQWLSRALTPFYQSHDARLGWLRDTSFTWMYRVPWLRKQMARTIAGIKLNPLQEMSLADIAQPMQNSSRDATAPAFNVAQTVDSSSSELH